MEPWLAPIPLSRQRAPHVAAAWLSSVVEVDARSWQMRSLFHSAVGGFRMRIIASRQQTSVLAEERRFANVFPAASRKVKPSEDVKKND